MKVDKHLHKLLTLWVRPIPKSPLLSTNQILKQEDEANAVFKPQHSLTKPYRGKGLIQKSLDWWRPKWNFNGKTFITSQYVGLTKDKPNQFGSLWCSEPLSMENWMTEIRFRIHGGKHNFGDGLTLWCTQSPPVKEPGDNFSGLAVSIDTHNDHHRHGDSIISAQVHSGQPEDGEPRVLDTCEAKLRNLFHDPWIQVAYFRNLLTVSMNNEGKEDWVHCFTVPGVLLPKNCYLGVSANTSELTDHHQVIEVKTYELEKDNNNSSEP